MLFMRDAGPIIKLRGVWKEPVSDRGRALRLQPSTRCDLALRFLPSEVGRGATEKRWFVSNRRLLELMPGSRS